MIKLIIKIKIAIVIIYNYNNNNNKILQFNNYFKIRKKSF